MQFLSLLAQQVETPLRKLGLLSAVAGLTNAGVLAVVNAAATHLENGEMRTSYVLMFAIIVLTYLYSQRYVLFTTVAEVEAIVHRIRLSLIDSVRSCELQSLEFIGRGLIIAGIDRETQTISRSASILVITFQTLILILFIAIYIATVSLTSFILAASFIVVTIAIYSYKLNHVNKTLRQAVEVETEFHDAISDLLDGFKEVKLHDLRSRQLHNDLVFISKRAARLRAVAQQAISRSFIFSQIAIFMLLGTMVFVVPILSGSSDVITVSTTAVLFLIGPISTIVTSVPVLMEANAAAEKLTRLQDMLAEQANFRSDGGAEIRPSFPPVPVIDRHSFQEIALRGVIYRFPTTSGGFQVGPIDLILRAGETVFLTGGNGSGKSTLLKLVTGLYQPQTGTLTRDGHMLTAADTQDYRSMFATVFSDFHLFRKLYGLTDAERKQVDHWLERMEISDKTSLAEDRLTTTDLSTGQRKRLALIVAILEKRPFLILDEWAADQDPVFRRKFYMELLPEFKESGITILAVTHDDRYFHLADRRLHMDEGVIVSDTLQESSQHDVPG
jgi:putative ATP-binding cassette transporter